MCGGLGGYVQGMLFYAGAACISSPSSLPKKNRIAAQLTAVSPASGKRSAPELTISSDVGIAQASAPPCAKLYSASEAQKPQTPVLTSAANSAHQHC